MWLKLKSMLHASITYAWYHRKASFFARLWTPCYFYCLDRYLAWRTPRAVLMPENIWSVTNVTLGGNGKTPFCLWLSEIAHQKGIHAAILLRGYARCSTTPRRTLAQAQVSCISDVSEVGDEALFLARASKLAVYVVDDPVDFLHRYGHYYELWISEDLYSRLRLWAKPWWMLHPKYGLGNGMAMPFGPLRFPASWQQEVVMVDYVFSALTDLNGVVFLGELENILFITAIAHPQSALETLSQAFPMAKIELRALPDHASIPEAWLKPGIVIVVTTKDAVKIKKYHPLVYVMQTQLAIKPSTQARVEASMQEIIQRRPPLSQES